MVLQTTAKQSKFRSRHTLMYESCGILHVPSAFGLRAVLPVTYFVGRRGDVLESPVILHHRHTVSPSPTHGPDERQACGKENKYWGFCLFVCL